jgi:hypothetical protein
LYLRSATLRENAINNRTNGYFLTTPQNKTFYRPEPPGRREGTNYGSESTVICWLKRGFSLRASQKADFLVQPVAGEHIGRSGRRGGMHMKRGIPIVMGLFAMLLAGGCGEKEEPPQSQKQSPGIEQPAQPESEKNADIEQRADRAAAEAEQAREKLASIGDQARELDQEAKVVGEEVNRVTRQVADLNTRLDQVAEMARDVITQAQQALNQVQKTRENLKMRPDSLLQEFAEPQASQPSPPTETGNEDTEASQESPVKE